MSEPYTDLGAFLSHAKAHNVTTEVITRDSGQDKETGLIFSVSATDMDGKSLTINSIRLGDGWTGITLADVSLLREHERRTQHAERMEALGRIASGVAHEFNNMLAIMMINLEMIQDQIATGDKAVKFAGEALIAGNRAAQTVRKLLATARKDESSPEVIEAEKWCAEIGALIRAVLGPEIKLSTSCEVDTKLRVDPGLLDAAIINIAANARDAMSGKGEFALTISPLPLSQNSANKLTPGKHYLEISLKDNGPGVPENIRNKIFDPFFTTKPVSQGLGLGLSTVYITIRQSDGQITVESKPGAGANFRIFLPIHETDKEAPSPAKSRKSSGGAVNIKDVSILLLEDEALYRKAVTDYLTSCGARIVDCETISEAKAALAGDQKFDIAIVDKNLTDGDGEVFARKTIEEGSPTQFILMSGSSADEHENSGVFSAVLAKPFSFRELTSCIMGIIK